MVAQSTIDNDDAERVLLRKSIAATVAPFGGSYFRERAGRGEHTHELWAAAVKGGFTSVNLPEEYGGGGAGLSELAVVCEEIATGGAPLLLMVVHSAICGPVIAEFGTADQRAEWLPRWTEPDFRMCFAITEPDAGSNSHEITTTARRDGDDWVLTGRKTWISGVDLADAMLVVGRLADGPKGTLRPALFVVPTDAPGLSAQPIPMEIVSPERQFQVFLDDVRLPADALVGHPDQGIAQLFAGLNPERVMAAAFSLGLARLAMRKATEYARTRRVWGTPIGAHQGLAHPLAACQIEIELARLMTQKAAWLIDAGRDTEAGLAANSAKYAAAEAAARTVDQAVQTHGGAGLSQEYGVGALLVASRLSRIAPVSREMILSFVAQHDLQLPRSY
jgi:alkylation response protein AidB-like acyl-CoA dehydrogenase